MKSLRARLAVLLVFLASVLGTTIAQDRYDHDRDDRDQDRRAGACFYKDADFRGDKFCLGPGERVPQMPPGFNDTISSIRIFGRTEITVYQDRNYSEPSLRLRDDVPNLQAYQVKPGHSWNDRISSIEVANLRDYGDYDRDGACFFKDADFKGDKFCVQKGDRMEKMPSGFNDSISSVRLYGRVWVTVYQDSNFGGPNLRLQEDCSNLQRFQVKPGHSWNDRISSIEVH